MLGTMLSVSKGLKKNAYFVEKDCNFIADRALFEVSFLEVNDAVASVPIGFKYLDGNVTCFAIFGYATNRNVFVFDDGSWGCRFVPTEMKIFPFCFDPSQLEGNDMKIYSDKLVDYDPAALNMHKVLTDEGIETDKTSVARQLVEDHLVALKKTRNVINSLADMKLLKEWPLRFAFEGSEYRIEDIYRIDESTLQELDGSDLKLLAKNGALYMAYAQIISEKRLNDLSAIVETRLGSESFRQKLLTGEDKAPKIDGASFDF